MCYLKVDGEDPVRLLEAVAGVDPVPGVPARPVPVAAVGVDPPLPAHT